MTTKTSAHIAQKLKYLREEHHLTQLAVAQKAHINVNYYAKLERSVSVPSLNTLEKIIKALGVHSSDVLPF